MRVIENCPPPPPERTFRLEVTYQELLVIQDDMNNSSDWDLEPRKFMLAVIALAL